MQLLPYLHDNYLLLRDMLAAKGSSCRLTPLQATYLAWLDIRPTGMPSEQFTDMLTRTEKVMLNPGTHYGAQGEGFVRINLATRRSLLRTAFTRLLNHLP